MSLFIFVYIFILSIHSPDMTAIARAIAAVAMFARSANRCWLLKAPEPFGLDHQQTRVENTEFKTALRSAMTNPLRALHCVYAPPGFGKTRAIISTATELVHQGHLSGAVVVRADSNVRDSNLDRWLKRRLHFAPNTHYMSLPELLPPHDGPDHKPILIVLDQFDEAATNPYLTGFIESLATGSARAKNYVVLVAVGDIDLHNQILRMNGGQKIQSVYGDSADLPRWDADMLRRLLDEKRSVWRLDHLDTSVTDILISIAAQVGTPGFLLSFLNLPRATQTVAEMTRRRDRFLLMHPM